MQPRLRLVLLCMFSFFLLHSFSLFTLSCGLEKSEAGFGIFFLHLFIIACITMTVFMRTRMDIDVLHGSYYMGALFYALIILPVAGIPKLSMTIRLEIFYKQKEFCFYPAWAYAIPASVLKFPLSFVESLVWTFLTYYVIGYSPQAQR